MFRLILLTQEEKNLLLEQTFIDRDYKNQKAEELLFFLEVNSVSLLWP